MNNKKIYIMLIVGITIFSLSAILDLGTVKAQNASPSLIASAPHVTKTYDMRSETSEDVGFSDGTHVWTGGLQTWIKASNGTYVPFIVSQNTTHLLVDSSQLPFAMNKTDCTITIFDNTKKISQNPSVLIGQQYVGIAVKQVGTTTSWTEQSVSKIACTYSTSTNSTGFYLTIQRNQANWGNLKSVYTFPYNGSPEVLNWFTNTNPLWSNNYKIGFIDNYNNVNRKSLTINQIQSFNFTSSQGSGWNFTSQTTFNKLNFINNNKIFILDPGNALNDLISVLAIQKTNSHELNIKFVYGKDSSITKFGQTVFQDPTFGWQSSTWKRMYGDSTGSTCPSTFFGTESTFHEWADVPDTTAIGCDADVERFAVSGINSTIAVQSTVFKFNIPSQQAGTIFGNCDYLPVTLDPNNSSNYNNIFSSISTGTPYVSNNSLCASVHNGNTLTLGNTANTNFANGAGNGWFAVAIRGSHYNSRDTHRYNSIFSNVQLQVNYTKLPLPPTNLTATTISSSQIDLSWSAPLDNGGTPINGYKIERSTNGGSSWSILIANTTNTATAYSDTGLLSGKTYTYQVSAINNVGIGTPSNTASATTYPSISLNVTSGLVGTHVNVLGNGFASNSALYLLFDTSHLAMTPSSPSTNSSGSFTSLAFTVPNNATVGSHTVKIIDASNGNATAPFTVQVVNISIGPINNGTFTQTYVTSKGT